MLFKLLTSVSFSFLIVLSIHLDVGDGAKIISYQSTDVEPSTMDCSKLKFTHNPGCVCVTGLWRFYQDCTSYYTVAGNTHCFFTEQVNFAMEVTSDPKFAVLIRGEDSTVIRLDGGKGSLPIYRDDLVVTGTPNTLQGASGSICLFPQSNSYCTYRPQEFLGTQLLSVTAVCPEDLPYLAPLHCDYIKDAQTCEEAEHALHKSKDSVKTKISVTDTELTLQNLAEEPDQSKNRRKRSAYSNKIQGRTFLGAPGQVLDRGGPNEPAESEDYITPEEFSKLENGTNDMILSEIWSYIEGQAEVEMGLRKRKDDELDYRLPYFKLLHLSKKVMQKVCPDYYVPPKFFDIAVQTFIQVQIKRFAYDPPNANFPGFNRIVDALEDCEGGVDAFPFLPLPNGPDDDSDKCSLNGTGNGQYFIYNASLDLTVSESYRGLNKDPIIETVWKIFTATQAYCFPYFNKVGYNDHHRYMGWLTPMFQNDIHDVWMLGTATEYTYGKFLGNMSDVITKVGYCAASARLPTTKVVYPWDLNRPERVNLSRKKRQTAVGQRVQQRATCLIDTQASVCFSNAASIFGLKRSTLI